VIKKNIICYCCLGKNNRKILVIKNFPVHTVNNFSKKHHLNLKKNFNLILYLCLNCKNIFYRHQFKYSDLYNNFNTRPFNYKNTKQYKFYFNKIKENANLTSRDVIYEIGKNNYNLKKILLVKNKVFYFDPRKKNINNKITSILFNKKNNLKFKPKIINCYNFAGNILDINNFLSNIKKILHLEGVMGFYFHYGPSVLRNFSLDKIYSEHINYFSITGLTILLKRYNLKIIDLAFYEKKDYCHIIIRHLDNKKSEYKKNIMKIIKIEKAITIESVYKFKKKLFTCKKKVDFFLKKTYKSNNQIVGYGASISSFPLILIFNLKKYLKFIYDDYPLSRNIFLNNKFIKLEKFKEKSFIEPTNFIILAPRYITTLKNKIFKRLKKVRVISLLPTLKVYSKI
jgi:hypothetical protein